MDSAFESVEILQDFVLWGSKKVQCFGFGSVTRVPPVRFPDREGMTIQLREAVEMFQYLVL